MQNHRHFIALTGLALIASLQACTTKQTLVERNFGDSVRNMVEAQTFDPSTLSSPPTETIDSGEGRRLEAVLETYRTDVAKPAGVQEDVVISVDGGQ